MKIVQCLNSLNVGGAESLVTDYAIYLKEKNFDIEVVIFDTYKESILHDKLVLNNVTPKYMLDKNHQTIFGRLSDKIKLILNWKKFLQKNKVDIIHSHIKASNYMLFVKSKDTKLFYTYHSNIDRYVKYLGKTWLNILRFLISKKDLKTFVLNSKMLNDAKKIVSIKNVFYIPNSVDFTKIENIKVNKNKIRKSIGIKDEFMIIHVGRINPVKNHIKLIEVFYEVKRRNNNSKLVIVGTGEEEYILKLKEKIHKLKIENDVVFLGLRDDVTKLLAIADCLVFPSFQEGFPMVVLEAQVVKTKCVVSKAVPEELVCNINCLSLDINDSSKKWADFILEDYKNPTVRDIKQYDMAIVMDKILGFYGG